MKILVVCQYYYPENFQITPICEQLVHDGHGVTVLTGLPNYPTGIIPDEYKTGHRDEIHNGVHIIRCHEIGRKKGVLYLGINYLSFLNSANKKIKTLDRNFDIVFVYQLSPVLMALPAIKYAKLREVPMLLYCCDLWPESMKMYLRSESSPLFKYIKNVSRNVYTYPEKIMCQSRSFMNYMKDVHAIRDEKLVYLPAFADESYLKEDFSSDNGVIDFVFLGNLGIAQNLIGVLKAVELIRAVPGFKVHFVGDGSALDNMKKFVDEHKLNDLVEFYGRRPVAEMPVYYRLADACIVSLEAGNAVGLTLPGKVQGYMAAGKPVIGMIDGSAVDVIKNSGCGLCVPAGDIEGLAFAMRDFIVYPEKYKDCGMNGRQYFINNFSKTVFIRKLEELFEHTVHTGGRNVRI